MTSKTVTGPIALDLMRQALEVKSADHVQTVCYYVVAERADEDGTYQTAWNTVSKHEPKPGCLVGTALFILDPEAIVGAVAGTSFVNGNIISDETVLSALSDKGIVLDADAVAVFTVAQELQDGRSKIHGHPGNQPWGVAVDQAALALDALTPSV